MTDLDGGTSQCFTPSQLERVRAPEPVRSRALTRLLGPRVLAPVLFRRPREAKSRA